MQTSSDYLAKTKSAVQKLFESIDDYMQILHSGTASSFITSHTSDTDDQIQYENWVRENENSIRKSLEAQREYIAESFAQAVLCGALLQVAAKALECYSNNTAIPEGWDTLIQPKSKAVPFCVGRLVRGIPLGLIIYAARNQHTHFDDSSLREPNLSVFEGLCTNHGLSRGDDIRDPAFDLKNTYIVSYSSNCTALIGWRSYENYEHDMCEMLGITLGS